MKNGEEIANEIHIEMDENIANKENISKDTIKNTLTDFSGWKKDLKKIFSIIAILLMASFIIGGIIMWSNTHVLGFRINLGFSRVKFDSYSHIGPDFNFKFPTNFVVDNDEQKKYGDSYLGGFRLKGDARTGCDVRSNPVGINFQKTDKEIHDAVVGDLSKHIKDFNEIGSKRKMIGGENAYFVDFSFTDPLGNTTKVSQAITSHEKNSFVLVCGTSEAQYHFFEADFNDFFKSFRWAK